MGETITNNRVVEPPKSLDRRRMRLCVAVGVVCFFLLPSLIVGGTLLLAEEQRTAGIMLLQGAVIAVIIPLLLFRHRWRLTPRLLLGGEIVIGIGVFSFVGAVLFSFISRPVGCYPTCIGSQHDIANAMLMYAQDHQGKLPSAYRAWRSLREEYGLTGANLTCPRVEDHRPIDFGYNQFLAGKTLEELPQPDTLLLIADGGDAWNLLTSLQDIDTSRHFTYRRNHFLGWEQKPIYYAACVDGHIVTVFPNKAVRLQP